MRGPRAQRTRQASLAEPPAALASPSTAAAAGEEPSPSRPALELHACRLGWALLGIALMLSGCTLSSHAEGCMRLVAHVRFVMAQD